MPVFCSWARAQQLLFGRMYEDAALECELFAQKRRVFSIASAGCTARALAAAGHEVTAVDANPRQMQYAEALAAGFPASDGAAERLLATGRRVVGWQTTQLREFLSLRDPVEQVPYWRSKLQTRRFRSAVGVMLSKWALRLVYAGPFVTALPRNFGVLVRTRLERGLALHPNCCNLYVWRLLAGIDIGGPEQPPAVPIRFACADAAAFLNAAQPGSFDAFTLSNILDGAPTHYRETLYRAVARAAAPGALVMERSFQEGASDAGNLALRDRSLLWGDVRCTRLEHLCCTF